MRDPLVIGNWKLNGSQKMVDRFITTLNKELIRFQECGVAIAPPNLYLDLAKKLTDDSKVDICAQDVGTNLSGAFTGEISAEMLKDIGAKYVIIGHSERRNYHQESDDTIAKKFSILKNQGLIPVLCIGETETEKKDGKTEEVCCRQLDAVIRYQGSSEHVFRNSVIAYEPIWAIGTGKSATPDQAQAVHKFIRDYIRKISVTLAEKIIIQYGGSVNAVNAPALFKKPDIDGVLVGGASLNITDFITIIKASVEKRI